MKVKNAFALFGASLIWGTAFVAQRLGMSSLEPFSFNGIRAMVGFVVLLCVIGIRALWLHSPKPDWRTLFKGGVICGIFLFAASSTQQIGIKYTSAGKAGFITAFYIVLVPVAAIFAGRRSGWRVWAAVAVALAGLYLISVKGGFVIEKGDWFLFASALLFAFQILAVDRFAPKLDSLWLSCIQFLVVGLVSVPFMFAEHPTLSGVHGAFWPIMYAGVLSCGLAYTLQIVGQKGMNPAIASLIMSFESAISLIAGWMLLNERMTLRELSGCALMLAAILLAQIPAGNPQAACVPVQLDDGGNVNE